MEEEYDMEDADDDMENEFHERDAGGSDSDMDEYEYMVCSLLLLANQYFSRATHENQFIAYYFNRFKMYL